MTRAILRSFAVAACVAAVVGVARLVEFGAFCDERHAAERARQGGGTPGPQPVASFAIARSTEQIAYCFSRHCMHVGLLSPLCHEDLACYCTPVAGAPDGEAVAARLARTRERPITCVIDKRTPRPDDATGVCPRAHCLDHLDP